MSFWCRPADWRDVCAASSLGACPTSGFSDQALEAFAAVQLGTGRSTAVALCAGGAGSVGDDRAARPSLQYSLRVPDSELMPDGEDASAIIGIVGTAGGFQLRRELNRAPCRDHMAGWLERLVGMPVVYAPLPSLHDRMLKTVPGSEHVLFMAGGFSDRKNAAWPDRTQGRRRLNRLRFVLRKNPRRPQQVRHVLNAPLDDHVELG